MSRSPKLLYTAKTHIMGGREHGVARSSDGRLDLRLSSPGSARIGTNPEELFSAAWAACFQTALELAARKRKITLPAEAVIDAEVDLNLSGDDYFISARLNVGLPGVAQDVADALLAEANELCAYSKATHGNIDVMINLVDQGQRHVATDARP